MNSDSLGYVSDTVTEAKVHRSGRHRKSTSAHRDLVPGGQVLSREMLVMRGEIGTDIKLRWGSSSESKELLQGDTE